MQVELAEMGPELEAAVSEATITMEQIAKDTKVAEETKQVNQAGKTARERGGVSYPPICSCSALCV